MLKKSITTRRPESTEVIMRKVYVVLPLLFVTGCSSAGAISTTPATSEATTSAAPATAAAVASSVAPATTVAVTSSAAGKAGVGDTIDLDGETSGDVLAVTVVKVVDPDSANDDFSTPPAGDHYVSVQLQLVNIGTGDYQDDPFSDITAKDSAGQSMQQDFLSSTTAGTQLPSNVDLAPGDKALGFDTFDVPNGDKIAQVQYGLNAGLYGNSGEWTIG
jgi:hypothetical protein